MNRSQRYLCRLIVAMATVASFACSNASADPPSKSEAASIVERTRAGLPQRSGTIAVPGLKAPVEVLRDRWGIPHIYAGNTHDLFFAQGFLAAQTRMWQIEMWRRNAEGKLAEVLGPAYVERDTFARALKYRGDLDAELRYYHAEGPVIFTAFAAGINAAIREALAQQRIPVEFVLAGFMPEPHWTTETLVTRVVGAASARGAAHELRYALALQSLGPERTQDLLPGDPPHAPVIPQGLDLADITPRILDQMRGLNDANWKLTPQGVERDAERAQILEEGRESAVGSNNWVVGGARTVSGKPLLANDPHRSMDNPPMRYLVHLVAPGWNMIGLIDAGQPGISIGHNEHIAWGWTNLNADTQDLYVEQTDPATPNRYLHKGAWRDMEVYPEEIRVKGREPVRIAVRKTIHGIVLHEDLQHHRAYTLRMPGAEPGGAGYSLGGLAVAQAKNWQEFLHGCAKWSTTQSTVYADTQGNIGYLPVGWIPMRPNWNGMLPVPGKDGRYEWAGYIPADKMPRTLNDERGFYATANNNVLTGLSLGDPARFGHIFNVPYRFERIVEVLSQARKFDVADMQELQRDVLSLPARELVPLLREVRSGDTRTQWAIDQLLAWNLSLDTDSVAATIYESWRLRLTALLYSMKVSKEYPGDWGSKDMERVIAWLRSPDRDFGPEPRQQRNEMLITALEQALDAISKAAGSDPAQWQWGKLHRMKFTHPLLTESTAPVFAIPPVARGGDDFTVQATGRLSESNLDEQHGASGMFVLDTSDWDRSTALNVPGNEAHAGSPHYSDLIADWGRGHHFPLTYSRDQVRQVMREKLILKPARR